MKCIFLIQFQTGRQRFLESILISDERGKGG